MAETLDWQTVEVPQEAIQGLVRILGQGKLLVLPTPTGPVGMVSALDEKAVVRLGALVAGQPLAVGVASSSAARSWVPDLNLVGQRLARHAWPGPLTLACSSTSQGLVRELPDATQVALGKVLHLSSPEHEAIQEVLRNSTFPVLMAEFADFNTLNQADLIVQDQSAPQEQGGQPSTIVAVQEEDPRGWRITRPGAFTEEEVLLQAACWIVFVCTGNTCRSPLAEALCKKRLAERLGCEVEDLPARGYLVLSAGLAAYPGAPAAEEAIAVAAAYGAELSGHRSRPLSEMLAAKADHLLAMTSSHIQALTEYYPQLGATPHLLNSAGEDLPDPIGQARPVYEECARQIDAFLQDLMPTLTHPASTRGES